MAHETQAKQAGAPGSNQQSGQDRQQQAYQRDQSQQGSGTQHQGAVQGQQGTSPQRGDHQRQDVQVGQGSPVQQRNQGGLARYNDPFAVIDQLSSQMDDLFDSFFYGKPISRRTRQPELRSLWAPEVDVREEENQLRVSVDLPGIPKDAVKVDIHDGALTIQGERREERNEGDDTQGFRRSERRYGSFYRRIMLPEGADAEQAQANMKEGVLEIAIPLAQRAKGRRIEIKG